MKKVIIAAGTAIAAAFGVVLLAPSAWAMLPPEDPGVAAPVSTSTTFDGIAAWQVVAIALVAVAIGAVGTIVAQRTRRETDARTVSMA